MTPPIMPERARQIIEKITGRHGFMPDEILEGDASREAVAARIEVRAALRSLYSAADVAVWLGEKVPARRREVMTMAADPELPIVYSLWWGAIVRDLPRRTMRQIADEVAASYNITFADLIKHDRTREFSVPRQHAMWLMCRQGRWSRSVIGNFLGGRDHTTVLHGERAHVARVAAGGPEREAA